MSDIETAAPNEFPRLELLSNIPPNTLMRNPEGGESGLWFRQHRGVVSPKGWLPVVFGNPEMEMVEELQHEPSREAERWRRSNPGFVAVLACLRTGAGDSNPSRLNMLLDRANFLERYRPWKLGGADAVMAQLPEMVAEGLVLERYDAIGLSIHAMEEKRLHLTSKGMAEAIRKGVDFKEQSAARDSRKRSRRGLLSRIAQLD